MRYCHFLCDTTRNKKNFSYIKKLLYLCTAKAGRTLKVCAYVRAKDKYLRKTKKNLHI